MTLNYLDLIIFNCILALMTLAVEAPFNSNSMLIDEMAFKV